jgi:hypothetical protein
MNILISYLKISSSSWKTEKKSSKGALKLEVPKMTKVEGFNPSRASLRGSQGLRTGSIDQIYNKKGKGRAPRGARRGVGPEPDSETRTD